MTISGKFRQFLATVFALSLSVFASPALAQDYPTRAITIYTSGTGGPSDLAARLLAPALKEMLGKTVIVQNRPANLLVEELAKQKPDGYSLMIGGNSAWTGPLMRKAGYDAQKDLAPISLLVIQPMLVLAGPTSGINSVNDLVAKAKANPGQLRYAASGIGGPSHLAAELFKSVAGLNIEGVFYKSNAEQQMGVMRGEADINFGIAATAKNLVDQGMLKALAVSTLEPTSLVPGSPTIASSIPGYEFSSMTVMFAPAKTPDAIIRKINEAVVKVMTQPDVKEKLLALGAEVVASSPEQLGVVMADDIKRIGKVIADANIVLKE